MAKFVDAQRDADDLAKLVNEDAEVTTRYGDNPKRSWKFLEGEFDALLAGFSVQGDAAIDAINADVVTVDNAKDSALTSINSNKVIVQQAADSVDVLVDKLTENYNLTPAFDFVDGFTIQTRNQAGKDADGNYWIYNGALPFEVNAGTVPSEPDYKQVTFNSSELVSYTENGDVDSALRRRAGYYALADAQIANLDIGQYVVLTDRANALFKVEQGGVANGFNIISINVSDTLVLQHDGEVFVGWLGALAGQESSSEIQAALDMGVDVTGNGNTYLATGLSHATALKSLKDITIVKSGNGVVLTSTGRASTYENVLIDGLNTLTGDNWVITADNVTLSNSGSRTDGGGLAVRAEGNRTKIIGSKEAYESVGQDYSIQIGNSSTTTLYSKLTNVDCQTGGGVNFINHGTGSIIGGQIGKTTVQVGSFSIYMTGVRFNGNLELFGSSSLSCSSITGDLTLANGTDVVSGMCIAPTVILQSGSSAIVNENIRESSIHLSQISSVGGVVVIDNLTGSANDIDNSVFLPSLPFAPVWTAETTAPSLGDGTLTGNYTRSGKFTRVDMQLTLGSTTTTGSGDWTFQMISQAKPASNDSIGSALGLISTSGFNNGVCLISQGTSNLRFVLGSQPAPGYARNNRPAVWGNGDYLKASITYPTR
tara:strand:+ start:711 stop:2672 length:1962 start_codon:yes stop_codon:yes gene_type:complete